MAAGGKPGNPTTGFPPFPPSLEIATRFPHSHTRYDFAYNLPGNSRPNLRKVLPMFPDRSVTYVPGRTGGLFQQADSCPFRVNGCGSVIFPSLAFDVEIG